MKPSRFNIKVRPGGEEFLFNSLTCRSVRLSKAVSDALCGAAEDEQMRNALIANGFLVADDIDEVAYVKSRFLQRRFSNELYHLTVNTTMDCNLRCAYCYESHKPGSRLSDKVVDAVVAHIYVTHSVSRFKTLRLTLFGGEPLLAFRSVEALVGKVVELSARCGFAARFSVVTNATLVDDRVVRLFAPLDANFQVTIDGMPTGEGGLARRESFKGIVDGLRLLNDETAATINLRINYDAEILRGADDMIPHLLFLDRRRTPVSLQKIWQVDDDAVSRELMLEAIAKFNRCGFVVNTPGLATTYQHCYADNFHQAVVNYDGSVFKCTARDFDPAGRLGVLTEFGVINWDMGKVLERMGLGFPPCCDDCALLPSCPGFCSQSLLEAKGRGESGYCAFLGKFSVEDVVLLTMKQRLIRSGLERCEDD